MALSSIGFFGGLALCVLNIIAAVMGLSPAIDWLFGLHVWGWFTTLVMIAVFVSLIFFWLEAGLSGSLGSVIFWSFAILAPFTYHSWGLPIWAAIALGLSPMPFYAVLNYLSDKFDAKA